MATERQVRANRANARKSTGPRTSAGKAKAAMNALSHGVLARTNVVLGEDDAEFERMVDELTESFRPEDGYERMLVERIIGACWRLRRLRRFETEILSYRLGQDLSDQITELRDLAEAASQIVEHDARIEELVPARDGQRKLPNPWLLDWTQRAVPESFKAGIAVVGLIPSEPAILRLLGNDAPLDAILDRLSRYERSHESSLHRTVHEFYRARERRGEHAWPVVAG